MQETNKIKQYTQYKTNNFVIKKIINNKNYKIYKRGGKYNFNDYVQPLTKIKTMQPKYVEKILFRHY